MDFRSWIIIDNSPGAEKSEHVQSLTAVRDFQGCLFTVSLEEYFIN